MLQSLQTFPKKLAVVITTIIALVATILLTLVMAPYTATAQALGAPTVLDFEFTWGSSRADEIISIWTLRDILGDQLTLTLIDFAFIPSYALLASGLLLLTTRPLPAGRQKNLGFAGVLLPLCSGILDVFENILLIQLLNGNISNAIAIGASTCATLKFTCLFAAIILFLGHLIRLFAARVKK